MSVTISRARWFLVAMAAAIVAGVAFAVQPRPLYHDPASFIVIGRGIVQGQTPFVDLWDQKPLATYLVGAVAWLLDPGDTTVSMQALSVVAIALAAVASGWTVSTLSARFWPGVATAIATAAVLAQPSVAYGGGMTELFGVTGLAGCMAAIAAMVAGRESWIWPFLAGTALAWAVAASLLIVGTVPALLLLWLAIPVGGAPFRPSRSNWKGWIRSRFLDRRLAVAILGAAGASLVIWWPVLAGGAIPAAFDALVSYNRLYSESSSLRSALLTLRDSIGYLVPLWLPTLLLWLVPTARRRPLGFTLVRSSLTWVAIVWLIVELGLLVLGRRFASHSLPLFVPPLGVLLGSALAGLWKEPLPFDRRAIGGVVCALAVVLVGWQWSLTRSADSRIVLNQELAAYLQAHSAPGDRVYVWGANPDLYLRANRDPAGPYYEMYALIMPGYDTKAVEATLRSWQARPPRLLLTSETNSVNSAGLFPLQGDLTSRPALRPLQDFVRSHYDPVTTLNGVQIWQYRG